MSLADGRDGLDLAGNLTVLGSIANLIVVQRAAASGVVIRSGCGIIAGSACR